MLARDEGRGMGMAAGVHGVSFWDYENVLELLTGANILLRIS